MSHARTLSGGMAVHPDALAVASVAHDHGAEVTSLGTMGTRPCDLDHRIRTLPSTATPLACVDEAGPCGSWRSRDLTTKGSECGVVAPSWIPNTAGDRVHTDRREALQLARLMRSGDLPPVDVPTVEDEAICDLTRAREDTIGELKAAKFRFNAFLLRHDMRSTGRAAWGPAHLRGLADVVCATPAQPIVFQEDIRAVNEQTARLQRLEHARHAQANAWRLNPVVEALPARRGVQCTVAVTLVAALGDLSRVATPRALMKCLGLVPSDYSTGERRRQGSITTAGNTHARRVLVEGAWASRSPANVSRHLQRRLEQHPTAIQDLRWKAHVRLCKRYRRLIARGQHAHQVVVAMARELMGFMGAIAQQIPVRPSGDKTEAHCTHSSAGCHVHSKRRRPGGVPSSTA
jgi:transposase